jgi:hypothetical protein
MLFADISNFNKVGDYLPILNGCLHADLIIILGVFNKIINSVYLKKWYKVFNLSAVIADVLILVIGIILTRYFYKFIFKTFSIWKFTALALFIQTIHDFVFYLFFSNIPRGHNFMLDFFNEYAKEVSFGAILGDNFMMILACLFSSHIATYSTNVNIIILIVSLYLVPYILYYERHIGM